MILQCNMFPNSYTTELSIWDIPANNWKKLGHCLYPHTYLHGGCKMHNNIITIMWANN